MLDNKRKFSAKRFYKLGKIIIIAVSIISGIYSIFQFSITEFSNFIERYEVACREYPESSQIYSYTDCMLSAFQHQRALETSALIALGIAIIFPLLFFGGTWLYRYLYPKLNKDGVII